MFSTLLRSFRFGIIAVAALIALIFVWLWPFGIVPTGNQGVVTQFGKIKRIEGEGLVLTWPSESLQVFNVRTAASEVDDAEGSTSDTQPVKVSLTVRYKIRPAEIANIYEQYSHNGDLSSYVATGVQEVFKAVTARYTATDLISKRSQVSADITSALQAKIRLYGADVVNIDMRSFKFSNEYMAAINAKVTEEQNKLAAENKALTVQAQQREVVYKAEAERDAAKAKADGAAYAKLTTAQAEADALKAQNKALQENKDVLELRRIEVELEKARKWDGKLPENLYASAPIPFLNVK